MSGSDESARLRWKLALHAERSYGAALRALTRQVQLIVTAHAPASPDENYSPAGLAAIAASLRKYSDAVKPWAIAVGRRMVAEANRRNLSAWRGLSQRMARGLRQELISAPTGPAMSAILERQVDLITSLPTDAAERVQEMSTRALITSERFAGREEEIRKALEAAHPAATGRWLSNRATLIARTETARAASVLTQARSEYIGAERYFWVSARDDRVRETHAKLDARSRRGETFLWSDPPVSEETGERAHPGQIWNCRCVALPVVEPE